MRAEVPTITKHEYSLYKKGILSNTINNYLGLILKELSPELREEAEKKGFKLVEAGISMDILTLNVIVPNGSKELTNALQNELIFCYLD